MKSPNPAETEFNQASRIQLSVLIPAHNEAGSIGPLLDALTRSFNQWKNGPTWEVIVVDDGSLDQTSEIVRSRQSSDYLLRLVRLPRQSGQSTALAVALQSASGEWVTTLDADGQNDPADIPRLWHEAHEKACDAVLGWRKNRQDNRRTRWVSRLANRVRNAFLGQEIRDTGCSTRLLRSSIMKTLPQFEGWHRFLGPMFSARGARIAQIPVNHHARVHGRSHYHWRNRGLRVIVDLFGVVWLNRRVIRPLPESIPHLANSWRLDTNHHAISPLHSHATATQSISIAHHNHGNHHP